MRLFLDWEGFYEVGGSGGDKRSEEDVAQQNHGRETYNGVHGVTHEVHTGCTVFTEQRTCLLLFLSQLPSGRAAKFLRGKKWGKYAAPNLILGAYVIV